MGRVSGCTGHGWTTEVVSMPKHSRKKTHLPWPVALRLPGPQTSSTSGSFDSHHKSPSVERIHGMTASSHRTFVFWSCMLDSLCRQQRSRGSNASFTLLLHNSRPANRGREHMPLRLFECFCFPISLLTIEAVSEGGSAGLGARCRGVDRGFIGRTSLPYINKYEIERNWSFALAERRGCHIIAVESWMRNRRGRDRRLR
jgi:hypothetical protein